jgi:hypothetical protein
MRPTTHACGERTRAAKIKLRLLIVKQEILAHLALKQEISLLIGSRRRAGGLTRAKKSTATNEEARVHPALHPRIATVSGNGTLKASTLLYLYGVPETNYKECPIKE